MTTQLHEIASDSHTYINQLANHVGAEVVLKGWLYNMRSSGKIAFPQLRDGTGVVQCVVLKNAISPELWEQLKGLGQESALMIKGTVRADSRAPSGYEIDVIRGREEFCSRREFSNRCISRRQRLSPLGQRGSRRRRARSPRGPRRQRRDRRERGD